MSRKSRMQNLREKKDRRMKIIAIGGAALLAVILAFEMPHYLGGGSKAPAATTSAGGNSTTTTPGAPATGAPAGTAAAAAVPVSSSAKLVNSDVQPTRTKSQLYSFGHFSGKDPFVSQIPAPKPTSSSGSPSSTGGTGSSTTSSHSAPSGTTGSATSSPTSMSVSGQANAATVEVNGKIQSVPVSSSFPNSSPVFTLVSVTGKTAKIGISNGSFSNGKQTVSVAVGRSLTLVNKANGHRYVLLLLSVS